MQRVIGLLCLLAAASSYAQETVWSKNRHWLEDQISTCRNGVIGVCQSFPGNALTLLFGINDFCPEEKCMQASEIAIAITKNPKWRPLGKANNQANLTRAQQMAQGGLPVVAVLTSGNSGIIAILMPGKPQKSPKWDLTVPLSVSTRPDRPQLSVYANSINFVFADPNKVKLYSQK
jgi:hypothetical protein